MAEPISAQTVEHIARLARLQMDADDVRRCQGDLSAILDYVAQLNEIDTAGVEPTAHPSARHSVWRDDRPGECYEPDVALGNAARRDGPFFAVPKVLDTEGAP